MTSPIHISQTAVDDPGVQALLMRHFDLMRASSPEESCHAMQPDALLQRGAVVFAARDLSGVVGVGALAQVDAQHGELKSMHTAAEVRRARGCPRTFVCLAAGGAGSGYDPCQPRNRKRRDVCACPRPVCGAWVHRLPTFWQLHGRSAQCFHDSRALTTCPVATPAA